MLEYLIKVTNNTLPAILAASLLMAAIAALGPRSRGPRAIWALALGCAAAVIYAALKRNTGFAVREYYDLGVLAVSVPASLIALVCMAVIFARGRGADGIIFRAASFSLLAAWSAYCLPNIILYPFEFSVGMDTIFDTVFLYKVIGYLLAICVTTLTGAALFRAARNLPPRAAAAPAAAALLVTVASQILTVAQILLGRGMIPRAKPLMSVVMWSLERAAWFMYAIAGLAFLLSLFLCARSATTVITGENPAARRKMKSDARRGTRLAGIAAFGVALSLLAVTAGSVYASRGVELSPPTELAPSGDRIVIPLDDVNDGGLHRFLYRASDGTEVRYIVIRKSEVAYGVGLDACDVCGASGYYQRKGQVVCILCDVVMNISTIGFPGGCNPVPLKYSITDGGLVIEVKDLEAERRRFTSSLNNAQNFAAIPKRSPGDAISSRFLASRASRETLSSHGEICGETQNFYGSVNNQNLGLRPNPPRGKAPWNPFDKLFFISSPGEEAKNYLQGINWADPINGFGTETQGFNDNGRNSSCSAGC
jgi:uncharacterized membrane protein